MAVNWATQISEVHAVNLAMHTRKITLPNVRSIDVDLESVDAIRRVLNELDIDTVIHAAAMTDIEACEADPLRARHVNVTLTGNVAQASANHGATLVHISTDHLFDGSKMMREEGEPVAPVNVYARTKAEAEDVASDTCPAALIIRTNFYGWSTPYRSSFSDTILASLHAMRPITLFEDVYYTPILIDVLAEATHELLVRQQTGVFNIVGDERISKFDFGMRIAAEFGLDSSLIHPSSLSQRQDLTPRPIEMSLSNRKVCHVLGRRLGTVQNHLIRMHRQSRQPQVGVVTAP